MTKVVKASSLYAETFIQAWELAIADVREEYLAVSFPSQWVYPR